MDPMRAADYHAYFQKQLKGGGGFGGEPFYNSKVYLQRGRGFGSFVSNVWSNWLKPLLWRGAKAVGNQALETGGNILKDLAVPENRLRAKEVALNRVEEGLGNLGTKAYKSITGSGRRRKSKPVKRKGRQTGRGLRRDKPVSARARPSRGVSRGARVVTARRGKLTPVSLAGKDIF